MARNPTRDLARGVNIVESAAFGISKYSWTQHSPPVGGQAYVDTIAPFFVFLSGMSRVPPRRHVGIIGIGLALNAMTSINTKALSIRIPGVLQRLGIVGLIVNEPRLAFLKRYHGIPLVMAWYAISLIGASDSSVNNPLAHPDYPGADLEQTAQTRLDRLIFGDRLYKPDRDPEGLLGILTTVVSMLIGEDFGKENMTVTQKLVRGVAMISAGEALHLLFPRFAPISKELWTPSFVLASSGYSILKYTLIEVLQPQLPSPVQNVLIGVGKRSLEAFIIGNVLKELFRMGPPGRTFREGMDRTFAGMVGPVAVEAMISLLRFGIVVGSTQLMVARNWKLTW